MRTKIEIDRVVTSAPGKVLITGGYLILERPNSGLVLSTNARFYAIIKPLHHEIKSDSWAWVCLYIFFSLRIILFIFYSLLLLIFIQAWTDVRLTSPQLSREALYKLALKNLDIQTVSSRHVFRFRLIVSLLASNVEIVCLLALILCSLWFLDV